MPSGDQPAQVRLGIAFLQGVKSMFGSSLNPLRFLFGPAGSEIACLALTPECMGWIPYLAHRLGISS